jgi:hypothetical protein
VSLGSLTPTNGYYYHSTSTTPSPSFSYATTITPYSSNSLFLNHPAADEELSWTAAATSVAPPVSPHHVDWLSLTTKPNAATVPTVPSVSTIHTLNLAHGVPSSTAVPIFQRYSTNIQLDLFYNIQLY